VSASPILVERSKTPTTPIFLGIYSHDGRPGASGVMLTMEMARQMVDGLQRTIREIQANTAGSDHPCEHEHPELVKLCIGLRALGVPCDGFTPAADALGAMRLRKEA